MLNQKHFKISDVESRIGLPRRAIQFYVDEGVVKPISGGGGRGQTFLYSKESLVEFGLVKQLAAFGMTVKKIQIVMDGLRGRHSGSGYSKMSYKGAITECAYISFYFNSDRNDDKFRVVYHPVNKNTILTSTSQREIVGDDEGVIGMDDYESCLVVNIRRIIQKIDSL